MSKKFPGEVLG